MMRDNCVIFTTPERQELRVVFDPDGVPFFCGADLAAIARYEMPRKAVTNGNQGVNKIDSVLRKVPWDNGMKRGRCEYTCFTAENAAKFLCKRPAPYAAIRWFEDEVIPKAAEISEEFARGYVEYQRKAERKAKETPVKEAPDPVVVEFQMKPTAVIQKSAVMERLDAIILECSLLKKELYRMR